ncbi:glycosyltransferase family 9 protein [Vibrio rumoiensis]|uniref:Heptosyltransferase n=1 Tax=Vibrio rumoiensis 1S-45 TaxID=1188252 RepID=A0A1E5E258_9VIBR|nr:glycosyltransferase family 9 protein [Vibrio rumoiensis]OEF25518.1 heptosyltransferase [Vibrio rumoiensis 1S-45]
MIKNSLRDFDRYRRRKMANLEPLLYRMMNNNKENQSHLLSVDEVKSIVIVRNNKRIGNMFFLIPFVKQVRSAYPKARITLLLSQPWQQSLFEGLGVDEFCFSEFSFSKGIKTVSHIQKLKETCFDLLLTPTPSVEDTLMASMLTAKNKVSPFHQRRDATFTHTYHQSGQHTHTAFNKLYLIEKLTGKTDWPICHQMALSDEELEEGRVAKESVYNGDRLCVAYFRGARGNKKLSDAEWKEILFKFEQKSQQPVQWVEILSPDITEPLLTEAKIFQSKNMRHLASFLKHTDAFLSCDTGPLHLADAAGANCIGLFNRTDPNIYGVVGRTSINIQGIDEFDAPRYFQHCF